MKNLIIILCITGAMITACILGCNSGNGQPGNYEGLTEITVPKEARIIHGKYLVSIMGCNDCHTPTIMTPHGPEKDTGHLLCGHPSNIPLAVFNKEYTKSWALFSLTGTAMAGPWGVSYAANLTSDATGIGNWTETQFFKAFRQGKFKGLDQARTLLPPMPWQMYANTKDEDVRDIFAYLKSTKPVHNVVPEPAAP